MQSLVLTQDGLQLADTPMPPVMPGDVRIEIRSVGICGTDIAIWKGEYDAELPIVLGHEFAGVIHESSVPDILPGTLVTSDIDISCGRCWYCRLGERHNCPHKEVLGMTRDGGLSEYVSVPAELVYPLPMGVTTTEATFVEPLASAIKTHQQVPVKDDELVLILGSGKLALLLAQVYDANGANVHIVGRNRWQLGLAKQLGFQNTYDTSEKDWKSKIMKLTHDVGPRVVVEATGNTDGIIMAIDIVRNGGIIALKSMHGFEFPFDPSILVNKELTLYGASRGPFNQAIDMLSKGRIEVKKLITKMFKLEDGAKAFEFAAQPAVTKVLVNI
jgi:alcohol dehydrogenase